MSRKGRISRPRRALIRQHKSDIKVSPTGGDSSAGSSRPTLLQQHRAGDAQGTLTKNHGGITSSAKNPGSVDTTTTQQTKTTSPSDKGLKPLSHLFGVTPDSSTKAET